MTKRNSAFAYVVCGCKTWNKKVFDQIIKHYPGTWTYIGSKDKLTVAVLQKIAPRYVFFLHWSWIVPKEITDKFTCINFHMTDVPYGRGGSPLQNLIQRGHTSTKLSALQMTPVMDGGPIYLKKPLSLKGTAQEILERSSVTAASMIKTIIMKNPQPKPQKGKVVVFKRRTPEQSEIPKGLTPRELYDFIRMLDAEGYPPAFMRDGNSIYEFTAPTLKNGVVRAKMSERREV